MDISSVTSSTLILQDRNSIMPVNHNLRAVYHLG